MMTSSDLAFQQAKSPLRGPQFLQIVADFCLSRPKSEPRLHHLSPKEQRLLRLAVNRLGEKGQWDLDELKVEF